MENISKNYYTSVFKHIKLTKVYLNTLNCNISHNTDLLNWFKELCRLLTKVIVYITEYNKKLHKELNYKEKLLLYLQQLLTSLSLLINIFVRESEVEQPLMEIRCFCQKQMVYSLDGIRQTLSQTAIIDISNGNFVKWMDSALDKLNEIDYINKKQEAKNIFRDTKVLFEEVLSHAMSIAQVTLLDDYKKIRGSSQSVLEALESLSVEINKPIPNTAMLNLFIDTCMNKLCALERRVNTAVLKLSLKVFSEYTLPLEAIHTFCFDKSNRGKQSELDNLIVELDLHVDRILQIGLFAVSCSSCSNNCVKIRSCLASLEALETELVPAFTSVLNEISLNKIQLSLLLKDYWLNQARILHKLICLIIDPFAFCEVIYEENKLLVADISESVKTQSTMDVTLFDKLLRQSKVLEQFMQIVIEDQQEANVSEIKNAYSDFKCVLNEVKTAFDVLPDERSSHLRIIKRCKILLSSIKNLWVCFADENTENQNLCTKDVSHVEKTTLEQASKPVFGNVFLDHIISRGKDILKDRSILYRTTVRNATFKVPEPSLQTQTITNKLPFQERKLPNLKLTHLRNKTFINSSYRNKTNGELQMTDILKELNNLTNASLSTK
ncbi:unnamed protein product [Diabrotica balteata]|uniref:Serendipity locus protein alpha n=1 Tax=Diabrotica balteata TaxID=107213 RepID=A0A9N9XCE8_DIABA|nr:unnamed protein product [Diabrotica balteata]